MIAKTLTGALLAFSMAAAAVAAEYEDHDPLLMDHGDGHLMDMSGGMVMGQNADTLPGGCDSISETKEVTVHAGHKYAEKFPGRMFAFDIQEFHFKPCTKLTVHFINEDAIRHQWMMHGLPKYLYPKGMFHLEVSGPGKISGTLILPPGDKTYLIHCDIAQHMEKGMKAQLKVGKGDGDLPSIPGVTAYVVKDDYQASLPEIAKAQAAAAAKAEAEAARAAAQINKPSPTGSVPDGTSQPPASDSWVSGMTVIGLVLGLAAAPWIARRFRGMSPSEVIATIFDMLRRAIEWVVHLIGSLVQLIASRKSKSLPEK